ncbi:uncharacterized protein BX663DRAFT_576396 [Cokeromyces recurvatus]|uniref:uncharacterized protein n=1 Tax=Cokeromyces recurvatus TaxID=90255 RepID=UPI00221F2446|nr:uncharacterized protein BX663DRAFT_576396 [Cokeromyces recurvatus]KAI7899882.1 hypothetical protein BX663DRAFT_576396 [Cokeromyces recurvatus]
MFKIPQIKFNGTIRRPNGYSQFEKSNHSLAFNIHLGLNMSIINDNLESITFESIRAIVYYPIDSKRSIIGAGLIFDLHVKSFGTVYFNFPCSINYDPLKDEGFIILTDIATKCGLLNELKKEDLYVEYDLISTMKIAGISVSSISYQSLYVPCPISTVSE